MIQEPDVQNYLSSSKSKKNKIFQRKSSQPFIRNNNVRVQSNNSSKSPNIRSGGGSSQSAERLFSIVEDNSAKKLIAELTQGKVNVDDNTILLINETEVLSKDGIHGKIASVGIGFGTGRHTEGRRSVIMTQNSKIMQRKEPPLMIDQDINTSEPVHYGRALSART